jgi:hypothetical protein
MDKNDYNETPNLTLVVWIRKDHKARPSAATDQYDTRTFWFATELTASRMLSGIEVTDEEDRASLFHKAHSDFIERKTRAINDGYQDVFNGTVVGSSSVGFVKGFSEEGIRTTAKLAAKRSQWKPAHVLVFLDT